VQEYDDGKSKHYLEKEAKYMTQQTTAQHIKNQLKTSIESGKWNNSKGS